MSAERPPSPDLSGLRPTYAVRLHRGLWWLLAVLFAVNLVVAVLRLTDGLDGWTLGLVALQLLGFVAPFAVAWWAPAAVLVRRDGLRFRRIGRTGPLVPWPEVAEIRVQGRWEDTSTVVLRDGRTRPLVAMPPEDAQRLADALIDAGSLGR